MLVEEKWNNRSVLALGGQSLIWGVRERREWERRRKREQKSSRTKGEKKKKDSRTKGDQGRVREAWEMTGWKTKETIHEDSKALFCPPNLPLPAQRQHRLCKALCKLQKTSSLEYWRRKKKRYFSREKRHQEISLVGRVPLCQSSTLSPANAVPPTTPWLASRAWVD